MLPFQSLMKDMDLLPRQMHTIIYPQTQIKSFCPSVDMLCMIPLPCIVCSFPLYHRNKNASIGTFDSNVIYFADKIISATHQKL